MYGFFSTIQVSELIFLLPEVCLLFSVLRCLLTIAKFDLQPPIKLSMRNNKITALVLKHTFFYLDVTLLIISFLFLQRGLDSLNFIFDNFDDTVLLFNHHFVFDNYSLFFKFMLVFSTRLILKASVNYILNHTKILMEFAILVQLFVLFLSILLAANDLVLAFIAIIGFSLNTYVLILVDSVNHNAREAAIKYYYLSALSSGMIGFGI